MKRALVAGALGALVASGSLLFASTASAAPAVAAHPLGNFTINHYDGLVLSRNKIVDNAVIDAAEIPTLQAKGAVDANGDGAVSDAERAAYAGLRCRALAGAVQLDVADRRVPLTLGTSEFTYRPGAVGLKTSRLTCTLSAPASLSGKATVQFQDSFDSAGVGWHEVTAVGDAVALVNSPLPATSISDTLLHYPNDLLASPLDVRGGTLSVRPDGASTYGRGFHVKGTNVFARALNHVNNTFNSLAGRQRLTFGVGILAVLLAMLLGAGHALLPGHGKTIMAAYLVGRRGRVRDVVAIGATVTLTHTAGVLILGLLISASATFEPTTAERWLGVSSGLLVVGVGLTLLRTAIINRRARTLSTLLTSPAVGADGLSGHSHGAQDHGPAGHSHGSEGHGPAGHSHGSEGHGPAGHSHGSEGHGPAGHAHPHEHGDHTHVHSAPVLAAAGVGPVHSHAHLGDHSGDRSGDRGHAGHEAPDHAGPDHGADEPGHAGHHHGAEPVPAGHEHAGHDHAAAESGHGYHGHSHGLFGGHSHSHTPGEKPFGRGSIVGLGIAGGLVPSPSALVVLLGAIALGRTAFGVILVLAYGFGLALTLTLAGVLLVPLRNRLDRLRTSAQLVRGARILDSLPLITAALVVLVGLLLAFRSLTIF